jgi:hypothetical protein
MEEMEEMQQMEQMEWTKLWPRGKLLSDADPPLITEMTKSEANLSQ